MTTKVPTNQGSKWSQPNNSDKFGNLWYTKNCNFDEEGYLKLSPRTVKLYSDAESSAFNNVVGIGRQATGDYQITASGSHWSVTLDTDEKTFSENDGTANPTTTANSHGLWFQGLWHASTATTVVSRAAAGGSSATWTSRVTSLTTGVNHAMCVFQSRVSLLVANANVLKQYNSSYSNTIDLTIPSDYEIIGVAYNRGSVGIITKLANASSLGQDQEAKFFVWGGASTGDNGSWSVGSDAAVGICPYKSTWAIVTRSGELLEFNGGGFTRLAGFPFYFTDDVYGDPQLNNALGTVHMAADGDVIHLSIGIELDPFSRKREKRKLNSLSGAWCYDPKVGLYHRYSPSTSLAQAFTVTSGNVNTTTDVMTVSSGTVPATGSVARLTQTAGIGGLTLNSDYYVIKTAATTFKLATTRANALLGTAIDLTSATAGNNYFWMYDLVDYGMTYYDSNGAINVIREKNAVITDVLFGARFATLTALGTNDGLCGAVPFLENRGYFVTPKLFASGITDTARSFYIKFRPLGTTDSIVVKYRDADVYGLPTTTASTSVTASWTSPSELYTAQDMSEAKTHLDAGGELEVEILTAAGAGACVQVESISTGSGIYSFVLKEEVLGAASGRMCHFIVHNWRELDTITSTSSLSDEGYAELPVTSTSKFIQFKVELRGSDIAIEEWELAKSSSKQSK